MKNETYFKLGQRIGSINMGDGTVTGVENSDTYPIEVVFDYSGKKEYFTLDGRNHTSDKHPVLSQKTGIPPIVNTPIWEPKDGEYVWCKLFEKSLTYVCYPFKCFDKTTPIVYESQSMENANQRKVYEIYPFDKPPFSPK